MCSSKCRCGNTSRRNASDRQLAAPGRPAVSSRNPSTEDVTIRGHASGSVCLTFDDGPDPILTPPLLDVLRDHGIRATFFVIGEKAERYPGIVRRMAAEGHCVGNHSFLHGEPSSISASQLCQEVRRTAKLLAGLLGHEVRLFRPPHGNVSALKLSGLWRTDRP